MFINKKNPPGIYARGSFHCFCLALLRETVNEEELNAFGDDLLRCSEVDVDAGLLLGTPVIIQTDVVVDYMQFMVGTGYQISEVVVLGCRVVDVNFRHAACTDILLDEPCCNDASLLRREIIEIAATDVNVCVPCCRVVVGDIDVHVLGQVVFIGEYAGQYILNEVVGVLDSLKALVQNFLSSFLSSIHILVLSAQLEQ